MAGEISNEMRRAAVAAAFKGREKIVHLPNSQSPTSSSETGSSVGDTEARQARISEIRRWRDQTADRYGQPDRFDDDPMLTNVKAWWRDADALLTELDALGLEQVGWRGPYGLIPGGMDNDPAPFWEPVYRLRVNGDAR